MEILFTHVYPSPVGPLYLAVDRRGTVHRVGYTDFRPALPEHVWRENKYACGELEHQLSEYFNGERRRFTVSTHLGGTEFQRAIWTRLQKISYGDTISYAALAQKIGRRHAARAVGQAVGANPVVIVIPCHRVIRSDGSYGEYARSEVHPETGRTIKKTLLDLEHGTSPPDPPREEGDDRRD